MLIYSCETLLLLVMFLYQKTPNISLNTGLMKQNGLMSPKLIASNQMNLVAAIVLLIYNKQLVNKKCRL
jgi:hypothetical protein